MDWEELLNEYLATHLTPQEVEEQKNTMEALDNNELMPIPKFKPGDLAYAVIDDFAFMHPHIAECRVTGYDWTTQEGFFLNIEGTKRDQSAPFAKNIPFSRVSETLFYTCEEAGRRVDDIMRERKKNS